MARPIKDGFSYFPKDTDTFNDRKIRRLIRRFNGNGYLTYDFILCSIFRDKGYYAEFDNDFCFDIADQVYLEETEVKQIISYCCEIDLFNKKLFEKEKVITSRGIQKRWLSMNAASKRKEKSIELRYLIPVDEVSSEKTPEISEINTQKKEKKEKKEITSNPQVDSPPEIEKIDYQKLLSLYHEKCKRMPQVKILSESRKKVVKARVKEHGKVIVAEMIEAAGKSPFLNGENDRNWTANFDWIFKPSNFVNIIEGGYSNGQSSKPDEPYKPEKW